MKSGQLGSIRWLFIVCLMILLFSQGILIGCGKDPVIGPINDQATVALIRFESQSGGIDGVVYRQINRFSTFLAESKVPVLVVFYASNASVNSLIQPRLEQMADDLGERLQIVWVDGNAESALAESFKAEKLPQFTVVVEASLKRTLVGYDSQGAVKLQELLAPYLVEP